METIGGFPGKEMQQWVSGASSSFISRGLHCSPQLMTVTSRSPLSGAAGERGWGHFPLPEILKGWLPGCPAAPFLACLLLCRSEILCLGTRGPS